MCNNRVLLVTIVAAFLFSGCNGMGSSSRSSLSATNTQLTSGIKSYENADYQTAQTFLEKSLIEMGSSNKSGQVMAHKYLAFINCVSNHEEQCRTEFRKAIDIDPKFDLKPAEAGHPIWGPVFRSVQAKQAK